MKSETPEQRAQRLARMKAWREANHERFLGAQKAWRAEHLDSARARSREYSRTHKGERATYRRRNIARISEQKKAERVRNADRIKATNSRYYRENANSLKARVTVWAQSNADLVKLYKAVSQARIRSAGDITFSQWKEILFFYGNACGLCQTSATEQPLTIDHFIPVSAGGVSTWLNLWPLCLPCNMAKHTTVPSGAPPHVAVLLMTAAHQEATA